MALPDLDIIELIYTVQQMARNSNLKSRIEEVNKYLDKPIAIEIDPERFPYINLHNSPIEVDLEDCIWRIHGKDDSYTLHPKSWLHKYRLTESDKAKIMKYLSFDTDMSVHLEIDNFVGRVNPLYGYSRFSPKISVPSMSDDNLPIASDRMTVMMSTIAKDPRYTELPNDEEKEMFIKQIVNGYKYGVTDQLNMAFNILQTGQHSFRPYDMFVTLIEPSIQTFGDMDHAKNMLLKRNPFPLGLTSFQFTVTSETKINLNLNFRFLDVSNLFDLLYGVMLLTLASKVSNLPKGKICINTPMLNLNPDLNEAIAFFDSEIPYYSLSMTDRDINDFSDISIQDFVLEKVD